MHHSLHQLSQGISSNFFPHLFDHIIKFFSPHKARCQLRRISTWPADSCSYASGFSDLPCQPFQLTENDRQFLFDDGQLVLSGPWWNLQSQLPLLLTRPPCLPRSPCVRLSPPRSSLASQSSTPLCTAHSSWWCMSSSGFSTSTDTKDGAIRVSFSSSACCGLPSAPPCSLFTFVMLWKPTTFLLESTGCSTASLCVYSSSLSA